MAISIGGRGLEKEKKSFYIIFIMSCEITKYHFFMLLCCTKDL